MIETSRAMLGIEFRIRTHRRTRGPGALALVLLQLALLAALALNRAQATPSMSASSVSATLGLRQFYLSAFSVKGDQASTACAEGYHFASIWEIADPSSLQYNTSLGATSADSGDGPPTKFPGFMVSITARGWVRTGYNVDFGDTVGRANCSTWDLDSALAWGTVANLPSDWTGGTHDIGVWNTEVKTCDTNQRVWCVQDDSVLRVFLPLVLKD